MDEDGGDVDREIDAEIDAALLEALRQHDHAAAIGDDIEKDIEASGPLAIYLAERRVAAVAAMKAFPDIDIENRADIRSCQNAVRMYLHVLIWVGEKFKEATSGAESIRRALNPTEQPRDD